MELGQVFDGPEEGEEHRVGQVGYQHADDHRPIGAQAAGRGAGGVAQPNGRAVTRRVASALAGPRPVRTRETVAVLTPASAATWRMSGLIGKTEAARRPDDHLTPSSRHSTVNVYTAESMHRRGRSNMNCDRRTRSGMVAGVVTVAVAVLGTACGGSSSSPSTTSGGVHRRIGEHLVDGGQHCRRHRESRLHTRSQGHLGAVTLTPTIGGRQRTAIVYVPTGYGATTPAAAGGQHARQRVDSRPAGGPQRHGRHGGRRRLHRRLPPGRHPGWRWLRMERPRPTAVWRSGGAGRVAQRRGLHRAAGPLARTEVLHRPSTRSTPPASPVGPAWPASWAATPRPSSPPWPR